MNNNQQQGKPQAQGREQTFEDYMRNARDAFVISIKNEERSNYLLTAIDSFLICFDQMREKLTASIPTEVQKEEWISCSERLPVGKKAAINTYIGLPGHITVDKDHVIFDDVHGDRFVYKYHDPAIYNNIYWLYTSAPPISHKEDTGLGDCLRCKREPATKDYNGHKYYVCLHCYVHLNNEFDEEYR